ncbi:hypothetical protein P5673_032973 [Acropora cervicornis]|uniref:Uncharacterized protein n=1 Tax=Acropora cervicornis TaxID=6130 RepID=A0AAD9PQN4_ACRCE|nr:hypothetical protein P5673_032973 [Acropora cervicornis]
MGARARVLASAPSRLFFGKATLFASRKDSDHLSVVKIDSDLLLDDVFEGLGKLAGQYETMKPVFHLPRRLPIVIVERVQRKLEEMTADGTIEKVNQPTDWVSSMPMLGKASIEADGESKIRICLDPRDLNVEKNAFKSVPEIWQRKMREHLDGLKGVEVIAGDFVLVGYCNTPAEWQDDHDRNVRAFLDRCYERNLKLNKNRARLKQHEERAFALKLEKIRHGEDVSVSPLHLKTLQEMTAEDEELQILTHVIRDC